jgi:hypothetical protein
LTLKKRRIKPIFTPFFREKMKIWNEVALIKKKSKENTKENLNKFSQTPLNFLKFSHFPFFLFKVFALKVPEKIES